MKTKEIKFIDVNVHQDSLLYKSDSDASISSSSISSQKPIIKTPRGPSGRGRSLKRGNGGGNNAQRGILRNVLSHHKHRVITQMLLMSLGEKHMVTR